MRVRVLFFGMLKEALGRGEDVLQLPSGATVADLLAQYGERRGVRPLLDAAAVSVNQEYARRELPLHDDDEVALLPPVSGGSLQTRAQAHTRLVREAIDSAALIGAVKQPSDGATVIFEGIVRDNSRGRPTRFLEYEAYEPMAAKELEKLAAEAQTRFAVGDVLILHRLGRLEIGETSVLIAVAAAHRAAAFDACRWLIDTLKRTIPIWKKEHFADGAVWADGEPFPAEIGGSGPGSVTP